MRKIFTLLTGVLLSVGVASADIVKLQPSEADGSPSNGLVKFKSGYTIHEDAWSPSGGNSVSVTTTKFYKYSSGKTYTISIPEGRQVTKVTIIGGTRNASKTTYLAELNYVTYEATDYVFAANFEKGNIEPTTYTIDLAVPASGVMSFRHQGTESLFILELTDEEKSASTSQLKWSVDEISYKVRGNAEAVPTFENPLSLPVTFSSSDTDIAEVDEAGKVVLKNTKEGVAKITADFEGDATYPAEKIQLTVTVLTNKVSSNVPVEGLEEVAVEVENLCWKAASSETATPGDAIYTEADVLTVTTPFAGKYVSVSDAEYSGQQFSGALQLRTAAAPSAEVLTGTENSGSTSLVLAPEKDMTFYLFARRQTVKKSESEVDDVDANVITVHNHMGVESTDGKAIRFVDQADPTKLLDYTLLFGKYTDATTYDYAYATCAVELQAGHTYTVFASGTTIQANGFGYTIKEIVDPNKVDRSNHVLAYVTGATTTMTDVAGYTVERTGTNPIGKGSDITVNGVAYTPFKLKGFIDGEEYIKYTVTAPEGKTVTKATVYAYASGHAGDVENIYFYQVGNHSFAKGDKPSITSIDAAEPVVLTFDHIMLNSFDMCVTTDMNDDICAVVDLEVIDAAHTPAVPVLTIGETAYAHGAQIAHTGAEMAVTVAAEEGHEVYGKFTPAEAPAAEAEEGAGETEEDVHAGYTKLTDGVMSVPAAGTVTVYAYNPLKSLKSAPVTLEFLAPVIVAPTEPAPIAWSVDSIGLKVRDPFTAPVLTNEEGLTVTFTSSDESVAAVSESGVITLGGALGTAIITAVYTDETVGAPYLPNSVSTKITVVTNEVEQHAWIEYEQGEPVEMDEVYVPAETSGALEAGAIFDNDALKVETVYKANYNGNYSTEFPGQTFTGTVQLGRVDAAPTADMLTGTEKEGNSPLIVTAKKDVQLVMFIRRQGVVQDTTVVDDADNNVITRTVNVGFTVNDNKGVRAVAHSKVDSIIDQQVVFGNYLNEQADGKNDYLTCAVVWNLKAGETYTVFARGTTICMYGLGYKAEKGDDNGDDDDDNGDDDDQSGIDTISATDAEATYYNLQGVRVDNPAAGQIVIRRQGNTVTKIVVR